MRLVLIGPPGSGKGTQAKLLSERLHLYHLGMGDILREAIRANTSTGRQAAPFVQEGKLVPDGLVNQLIAETFSRESRPSQFVMDGYPRTLVQARALDSILEDKDMALTAAVEFLVDTEETVKRLSGRRVCTNPECRTNYHIRFRPPAREGICDLCGSALEQRADDKEETIRGRLVIYEANSRALLEHYKQQKLLRVVQANNDVETVYKDILKFFPSS